MMKPRITLSAFVLMSMVFCGVASAANDRSIVNWLTVSDPVELESTWQEALVYLPKKLGGSSGRLVRNDQLLEIVRKANEDIKHPLILFMHYCEGLGHHREDMKRLSKLGFIVIAPDSFARDHRPLGCYEDREKFIRYFDIAVAFQKAELNHAVKKLSEFEWIDSKNFFLFGSGMGGLVVAHYEGEEFAGHLIEGWGCRGPNPIFDGIWAPQQVRVFTTVSRNAPFLRKNEGFSVDCEAFTKQRIDSVSVVLDRPAHQVSWYPNSYKKMIRFLMRDMGVKIEPLLDDTPEIVKKTDNSIHLREKLSDTAVYETAKLHCAENNKKMRQTVEPLDGLYKFVCE